jgi:hypothetical protein
MAKTPIMEISAAQAIAIATKLGVTVPKKDNGWRKIGNFTLRRLPEAFRKNKAHAKAYRLSAPTVEELRNYVSIANRCGRNVVITLHSEN